MLATPIIPQTFNKTHNCTVKTLSTEAFIIKNVIGEHKEIPQIIYVLIQECLSKGHSVNSILKWQTTDSCYWINSLFYPGRQSDFRQGFKIKTEFTSTQCIKKIKKLYKTLVDIENKLGIAYSKKYLEGYLEEKGICFNELPEYLN